MVGKLKSEGAIVIRGPSGTGKTQAALKLCDIARQLDGRLELVTLGADDTPARARKLVDRGPTLLHRRPLGPVHRARVRIVGQSSYRAC